MDFQKGDLTSYKKTDPLLDVLVLLDVSAERRVGEEGHGEGAEEGGEEDEVDGEGLALIGQLLVEVTGGRGEAVPRLGLVVAGLGGGELHKKKERA